MKMTYIVEVERGSEEEEMLRRRFNRYIVNYPPPIEVEACKSLS